MNRIIVLLLISLMLILSCGGAETTEENGDTERVAVEVARAELGILKIYRDFTGSLEGIEQADLTAKLGETITNVKVRSGDRVKAGDVVMTFDRTGPTSKYQQAKAQYELADKTLKKMRNLYDQGAISEYEYDNYKASHTVAKAEYRAAREVVDVPSPIRGVVTDIAVNEGDQTFVGQKVATVSRVDSLRMTLGVDPADLPYIQKGRVVTVYPAGDKDFTVDGVIRRVASSADPDTRAFSIEVVVEADQSRLRPGSFAGCTIPLRDIQEVVLVPDEAVMMQEGIKRVYKVNSDTAHAIEVMTGHSSDGFTEIVSGVTPGEAVVVVGQAFLQDRTAVSVTNVEEASR